MNLFRAFLERVLGLLAALLLFAMMALTFVDVIGRYLFNAPVPGGFEMTEFMLATLIFIGLPLVTADEGHVCVDLFDAVVPSAVKAVQATLVNLICTFAMGVMSWRLWLFAVRTYEYGDTTAMLQIPYTPLVFLMAIMSTITAFVLVLLTIARGGGLFSQHHTPMGYE